MAMFYDLCVEYDGVPEQSRREVAAMALQLGYTGIAYNHVVGGLISDKDRCKIGPIQLSSLEAAAAGVAEGAAFHQKLLGVPAGTQFRQYSRVTVLLDDSTATAVIINSSLALRSYDLVAVEPTTLKAFGQACHNLEVDIISVDLGHKLPFRMKQAMVKAAVERGILFEIKYGRAIFDPDVRREVFANAQMLQGWTRGRNIVLSSGATNGMELRGPNDVANLSTLFGLTPEFAKAAVSKNCRSALLHGVTRRKTYKGAIGVERCEPDGNLGSDKLLFNIPTVWDPLVSVLAEKPGKPSRVVAAPKADKGLDESDDLMKPMNITELLEQAVEGAELAAEVDVAPAAEVDLAGAAEVDLAGAAEEDMAGAAEYESEHGDEDNVVEQPGASVESLESMRVRGHLLKTGIRPSILPKHEGAPPGKQKTPAKRKAPDESGQSQKPDKGVSLKMKVHNRGRKLKLAVGQKKRVPATEKAQASVGQRKRQKTGKKQKRPQAKS